MDTGNSIIYKMNEGFKLLSQKLDNCKESFHKRLKYETFNDEDKRNLIDKEKKKVQNSLSVKNQNPSYYGFNKEIAKYYNDKRGLYQYLKRNKNDFVLMRDCDSLIGLAYFDYDKLRFLNHLSTNIGSKKLVLTGFQSSLTPEQVYMLFDQLKGNYIDINTDPDHFKALFKNEPLPDEFKSDKIIWNKSIPLFCCLFFGYKEIEHQNQGISFNGIIDKETVHFYKKAVQFFSFGTRKVTNRTLSEKATKLCYSNAPQNFNKLFPIIKTVQASTV